MDALEQAGVSAREREVLSLLRERLTNAEIADELFISVRTVESHVSALLRKLELNSRRDLSRFAPGAMRRGFPVAYTSLVGRRSLLEEIQARLSGERLVTLTGVGGSGKTRMAIEAGNRLASSFRHGAVFVDLVPLGDPRFIAATAAKALGIGGGTMGTTVSKEDEVVGYLSRRCMLVVLDNCEHVIEGVGGFVNRVLAECPDTTILATSRQGFAMPGESLLDVPPLDLPDDDAPETEEAESLQLLVDRARAVRSELDLFASHRVAAIEICRRLDGIPLAIELAAVQLAHLTPEEVASRLDERFRLLGGRRASAPPKSTLQTAIDWSYGLLSETERSVFNRIGVFAGSFSPAGAGEVCDDRDVETGPISEVLGSLVWKSLVIATSERNQSRYRLLETIRAYARERLDETGEGEATRARLCRWLVQQVEEAAPHLMTDDTGIWLARLDEELGNLRVALAWAIQAGRADQASRLVVGLWHYWHMRGDIEEGRRWVSQVLAVGGGDPLTRARTLEAAGGLAYWGGVMEASREHYEEALTLLRAHGSEEDVANALYNASFAYGFGGRPESGMRYAEEARQLYERLGDVAGTAKSLWGWGASAHAGGHDQRATTAYEKALAVFERLDDTFMLGWTHRMLARSLLRLGKAESARPHLDAGIGLFDANGDVSGIILHLRDFAELAILEESPERAVILAGAVRGLEDESGLRLLESFSEQLEGIDEAWDTVGDERAQELFDEGRGMSRTQAIRFARDGEGER